jgi:hypothetical protein
VPKEKYKREQVGGKVALGFVKFEYFWQQLSLAEFLHQYKNYASLV